MRKACWTATIIALYLTASGALLAEEPALELSKGQRQELRFQNAGRLVVTNPEVLAAEIASPDLVILEGLLVGETVLHVWDDTGLRSLAVLVTHGTAFRPMPLGRAPPFRYEVSSRSTYRSEGDRRLMRQGSETVHRLESSRSVELSEFSSRMEFVERAARGRPQEQGLRRMEMSYKSDALEMQGGDLQSGTFRDAGLSGNRFQGLRTRLNSSFAEIEVEGGRVGDSLWSDTESTLLKSERSFTGGRLAVPMGRLLSSRMSFQQALGPVEASRRGSSKALSAGFTLGSPAASLAFDYGASTGESESDAVQADIRLKSGPHNAVLSYESKEPDFRDVLIGGSRSGRVGGGGTYGLVVEDLGQLSVSVDRFVERGWGGESSTSFRRIMRNSLEWKPDGEGLNLSAAVTASKRPLSESEYTDFLVGYRDRLAARGRVLASLRRRALRTQGFAENDYAQWVGDSRLVWAFRPIRLVAGIGYSRLIQNGVTTGLLGRLGMSTNLNLWSGDFQWNLSWQKTAVVADDFSEQLESNLRFERNFGAVALFASAYGVRSLGGYTTLYSGGVETGVRFSGQPSERSSVRGVVFLDSNRDGRYQRGEQPLADITVFNQGIPVGSSNRNGRFSISRDAGAPMWIEISTEAFAGSMAPTGDFPVHLSRGQDTNGIIPIGWAPKRQIAGVVFRDDNGNGRQDSGEPGLQKVLVKCGTAKSVRTDSQGTFILRNLDQGMVDVWVDAATLPKGFDITGSRVVEKMVVDGTDERADFSIRPLSAAKGRVCADQNGDGVCQASEPGIPSAQVWMSGEAIGSDIQGRFLAPLIKSGEISVRVEVGGRTIERVLNAPLDRAQIIVADIAVPIVLNR